MTDYDTWKMIPDTDNKYEICNRGIVRRIFYKKDGSIRTKRNLNPVETSGSLRVYIKRYGKSAYFGLHRLVAEAFMGLDVFNVSHRVIHKDGNIYNNLVDNLKINK